MRDTQLTLAVAMELEPMSRQISRWLWLSLVPTSGLLPDAPLHNPWTLDDRRDRFESLVAAGTWAKWGRVS